MEHLLDNGFITVDQHGCISGRSCTTNLLMYLNDCTLALDDGQGVDTIYLDYKKAFDSVPHKRLLHKLRAYGISGKVLAWIDSFLHDRYQTVVVDGAKSNPVAVVSGVLQGSVLGPLLFILYVNDLPDSLSCPVKLFVDDTKPYHVIRDVTDCEHLQANLNCLTTWTDLWQLSLHPDKCVVLRHGKIQPDFTYQLTAQDDSITHLKVLSCTRDLGVTVDDKLTR